MAEGSSATRRALPRQQDRVLSLIHTPMLTKTWVALELAPKRSCAVPGVSGEVVPPVPIPNTAVKRLSADDTGVGNPLGK